MLLLNYFQVGLPAKSGVAGGILLVVPNVMGMMCWSPPLDKMGNSVKGIHFCHVSKFSQWERGRGAYKLLSSVQGISLSCLWTSRLDCVGVVVEKLQIAFKPGPIYFLLEIFVFYVYLNNFIVCVRVYIFCNWCPWRLRRCCIPRAGVGRWL